MPVAVKDFICLLFFATSWVHIDSHITCLDNLEKSVDWFLIYKLPAVWQMGQNWTFPPHLYMDDHDPQFVMSDVSLNDSQQAVAFTLDQAYQSRLSQTVGYIFYNDEKPDSAGGAWTEDFGHTKGVVIFDATSGIWLIHSVPKYPPPTNTSYSYPESGVFYGQHYLCVSLHSADDVTNVGSQLLENGPFIFDSNLPPKLKAIYPVMADVLSEITPVNVSSVLTLTSPKKRQFISFAKSKMFHQDLYDSLVAPVLRCNMSVESWQHGDPSSNINSTCDKMFRVFNIQGIHDPMYNVEFPNSNDHSKFAICDGVPGSAVPPGWVCIGDINRQVHQMERGGGAVCLFDISINSQYRDLVSKTTTCPVTFN